MTDSPHLAWLPRIIVGLVDIVATAPRLVLLISFGVAAIGGVAFCTSLEYRTQRSDLMSPDKDYQRRWQRYVSEFGEDDDMVVVVEGGTRERRRAAIERLAGVIGRQPHLFERLFWKVDLANLRSRALLFMPADQLAAIDDNLHRMGPLLSGPLGSLAWKSLNLTTLLRQARIRAGQFDPSVALSEADTQFLTQLHGVVGAAVAALQDPAAYRNPWSSLMPENRGSAAMLDEPQYLEAGDGAIALLLVRPVKEAGSFTPALASVQALRSTIAAGRTEFADCQFGLTGLPVLETDEMEASQSDTNRAGWLALGGVAALYLVVYRGLRRPLLTVLSLVTGTLWAMGWLTLTVGHLNILSSCFAVMLIGIGDYGVLWIAHYEVERRAGRSVAEANRSSAVTIGPSIVTAAFTTAFAFFAAMLADFQAVAELGWIAGCGVLFCALATLIVMPSMLVVSDRRGALASAFQVVTSAGDRLASPIRPRQPAWLPGLMRRPQWVLAASVGIAVVAGVFASRVRYDHNLLHMQSSDLESVRWEHRLLDQSAGSSWCALSHVATPAEARALQVRYEQLPEVSRVVSAAMLIPPDQDRKLPLVRTIHDRLTGLPELKAAMNPTPCSPADLRKEIVFLMGALAPQAPVSPQPILEQLLRCLAQLRDQMTAGSDAAMHARLNDFGQRLTRDLLSDLHKLRDVSHPTAIGLGDLPQALHDRWIGRDGRWLVQAYARDGLWDIEPLEQFVRAARTVDPEATGKPFGTLEGLRAMQHGFAWAGVYALTVIVAVLAFDFRTVRHTLLALAPLAMGAILTLGIMGLCGVALNPANMIALPLIVGVGVDNGVHVLHDFLTGGKRHALARTTGVGIAVSALTTVLGFGTLMVGSHRGLVSLGLVLAIGVTACMAAALVMLPAALQLLGATAARTPHDMYRKAA